MTATLVCTPRITVRQLNRRGACLDQVTRFRMRFGHEAIITVEACAEVCHDFDFEWASDELLHVEHANEVWAALNRRLAAEETATSVLSGDPPMWMPKPAGFTLYDRILAEEFAKKYVEAYPNVP